MSDKGNMSTLANNVAGIISYTDVLVSGKSRAQHNSEFSSSCDPGSGRNCAPLGNAFYLKTGGKCKDRNGRLRTRYMYINNKPTGAIPFISNMTGKNLPGLRGLIPGAIENLGHINPLSMFSGFMQGSNPKCRILKLKGEGGNGRQYVADADIADLAASYAYGLAKNHPFVDGNKRVAFLSVGLFLGVNGYKLIATPVDAIQAVLGLAGGEITEEAFASWIRDNIKSL